MGLLIVNELSVQMIRSAAAALSILVLASCSHKVPEGTTTRTPESSEYRPPAQVRNATYAWSAENGIDLLDERGQLVRAAHESMIIAHYGGMDATYPGFAEVLDPEFASQVNTRWDRSLAGTMQSHILQITETDIGFKATVCSQPSHFAIREADGTYRITNGSGREEYIQFEHIVYTRYNQGSTPRNFWPTTQHRTISGATRPPRIRTPMVRPNRRPLHRHRLDHHLRRRPRRDHAPLRRLGTQHRTRRPCRRLRNHPLPHPTQDPAGLPRLVSRRRTS